MNRRGFVGCLAACFAAPLSFSPGGGKPEITIGGREVEFIPPWPKVRDEWQNYTATYADQDAESLVARIQDAIDKAQFQGPITSAEG